MADEDQRHRLVVLGAGRVGKTCLLQRFLNNKFIEAYRPTVEDLHCKSFVYNGSLVSLDILDTAGNLEFPAMRRLSISTAHAFLLVFAIDNRESFEEVRCLWQQIEELRTNLADLPRVVAANKSDLASASLQLIAMEEPEEWARQHGLSDVLVQVSAKTGENVNSLFKKLAQQASLVSAAHHQQHQQQQQQRQQLADDNDLQQEQALLKRHSSANSARLNPTMAKLRENQKNNDGLSRSRSLIRRVRKSKVPRASSSGTDECKVQ